MNRRDFIKCLGALAGAAALRLLIGETKSQYKMHRWQKTFDFSGFDDNEMGWRYVQEQMAVAMRKEQENNFIFIRGDKVILDGQDEMFIFPDDD